MKKLSLDIIKEKMLKKDNMVILILTGVLLLVIAWPVKENTNTKSNVSDLWDKSGVKKENNNSEFLEEAEDDGNINGSLLEEIRKEEYIVNQLEERLEEILSSMQGVGAVRVMITLASQGEKIVEKDIPLERNNIVENDSGGGSRSTSEMYSKEETVYTVNSEGDKVPYVTKEKSVEVAGVSVVAQGGDQALVQKNISDVIQALFGIEEHKIKVVKMKNQE